MGKFNCCSTTRQILRISIRFTLGVYKSAAKLEQKVLVFCAMKENKSISLLFTSFWLKSFGEHGLGGVREWGQVKSLSTMLDLVRLSEKMIYKHRRSLHHHCEVNLDSAKLKQNPTLQSLDLQLIGQDFSQTTFFLPSSIAFLVVQLIPIPPRIIYLSSNLFIANLNVVGGRSFICNSASFATYLHLIWIFPGPSRA